ncbi:MAG: hypothetical protein P8N07_12740 [Flavobacteriales bacterium]|nr:hypothetical protein [Flavobacteriales bacterium]
MKLSLIILATVVVIMSCSSPDKQESNLGKPTNKTDNTFAQSESANNPQDSDEKSSILKKDTLNIKLTPFVPKLEGIGQTGRQLLKDRLNSAITKIGFGGEGSNPRFVIGPSISILTSDVTSTAPTKYANTYEINFMVVDMVSETIFTSYKTEFKGVGDSPEKAFISGIRNISYENQDFMNFLKESESKILAYFEGNCSSLLTEAEAEAGIRNYDNAFALLNSVPKESASCFEQVQMKKAEYFQLSLNTNCNELLAKMKAELGKYNDASGAGFNPEAMSYYSMIDSKSECYNEAQEVYKKYTAKLNPTAKRDWEQKMVEYKDQIDLVKMDKEFEREAAKDAHEYKFKLAELQSKTEIEGNKKLLAKYKHDESPWLIRLFSSGSKLFKGEMKTN